MTSVLDEPVPAVDLEAAGRIAAGSFGVHGVATPLRSERDRNFLVDDRVLKVSNSAEPDEVIDCENAAMQHVATQAPDLPVPRLVPARDGRLVTEFTADDGRRHLVRMVTVLPGDPADEVLLGEGLPRAIGEATARLSVALRGFVHPASVRDLAWDPRSVARQRATVGRLGDAALRGQLLALLDQLADLPQRTAGLPAHPHHADVTLSNVLTDGRRVTGLIDFGDLHHTARASDAAIALAAVARGAPDPWRAVIDFLEGYQSIQPLLPEEVAVLGDLVLARLVLVVVISATRPASDAHQAATVADLERRGRLLLATLLETGRNELRRRIERACGLSRVGRWHPDPTLLPRRQEALGGTLSPLFYDTPLQITHGRGAWVWGADGTRYLDAYNNVPVVGHAHPAVAQAVGRQLRELAVHSRYLHPHLVELAERLLSRLPDELDTVVLVNSGSEANDLAWRLATHWTGRHGAVVSDWAYHGVSEATAALSSNTWVTATRPGHVATYAVPWPDPQGRRPERDAATARLSAALGWLAERGHEVALAAADLSFTSPGVLTPSAGFVRGLVDATHAAGGLFLADEVQAGYGRSGTGLWSFAQHDVVPDFVTLGKPMGNGHPVAALATRREIVARFGEVDEFFSTFGGNPVSCVAALTVLDLIDDLDLVDSSAAHGAALRAGMVAAGERAGVQVIVRGQGLLAGAELPSLPGGVPRLVSALVDHGVLTSTTGRGGSVLKVRPPLIWEAGHVEHFLDAFESALGDLA